MDPVNLGLIGCGVIGQQHLTSLKNALTITRITDAIYRSAESGRAETV